MNLPWHHFLGMGLTDVLTASRYEVELEKELSLKSQRLDYVIIERKLGGEEPTSPPDGLEELRAHNLLTYKSHHDSLSPFVMDELLGHYVNYRKQVTPDDQVLVDEGAFKLLAVCARRPVKVLKRVRAKELKQGVYEVSWGSQEVTLVVCGEVEACQRNALWLMFSAESTRVELGLASYRWRQESLNLLRTQLYNQYTLEGFKMGYTIADYRRDYVIPTIAQFVREEPEFTLALIPPELRLKGLTPEELLKGLTPEERVKGLTRQQLEAFLKTLPE
ncbi:MAG: hypothetical protein ACKO6N_01305 [Myxococcota bacterium]